MNYELLKAQSSFSLEDIFLIYLKIEPSNYKQMDGTYYWLDLSHSDYDWGDNDTTVISRIYKMRSNFLKDHSDIVTEEKINAAYKLYNSLKFDAESKLLKIHSTDTATGQVFVLRENIHQWFVEHQLTWPDELKPFKIDSEMVQSSSGSKEINLTDNEREKLLKTIHALTIALADTSESKYKKGHGKINNSEIERTLEQKGLTISEPRRVISEALKKEL